MTQRGIFITFEGIDGAGKTTQVQRLATALGPDVVLTREPGGTPISERIREIFLTADGMAPMTELLLIAAARAQHVDECIRPALESSQTVICDRFIDATVAYQGYRGGIDLEIIHQLNHLATGGLTPNITFILDLPRRPVYNVNNKARHTATVWIKSRWNSIAKSERGTSPPRKQHHTASN